jgi:hypothetical protein
MRWYSVAPLLPLALLLSPAVYSQSPDCTRRTVPVSVSTPKGTPVTGLQASNFEAALRGTPVQIVSIKPQDKPSRVVLLLDASSSVTGNSGDAWHLYLAAADHLLANLPQGTSVALEIFASRIVKTEALTEDRAKLRAELKNLSPVDKLVPHKERETALWEALREGAEILGPPEMGDMVYVYTDAGNNFGKATFRDAEQTLQDKNIRVFWLYLDSARKVNVEVVAEITDFTAVVSDTGGAQITILPSRMSRDFPFIDRNGAETEAGLYLQKQYELISHFYRLEIGFPTPPQNGAKWNLKVKVPNARNLQILYPRWFSDCSDSSPHR